MGSGPLQSSVKTPSSGAHTLGLPFPLCELGHPSHGGGGGGGGVVGMQ